jgi:hypothetical protein
MGRPIHVWTRTTDGQDRCWYCGGARMRVRRVHGPKGVLDLFWTPTGWTSIRPKCVAKRASPGRGEPGRGTP